MEARKLQPCARFDLPELRTIALSTLVAIESVHQAGYVHRDIKPANFALSSASEWTIIDFGLARQIINDDGTVMPERVAQGFRGSTVYASAAAHAGKDVGRKDDLWSWVYVLAELVDGSLPWRFDRQQQQQQQDQQQEGAEGDAAAQQLLLQQQDIKEETFRKKQRCMGNPSELTTSVPLPGGASAVASRQLRAPAHGNTQHLCGPGAAAEQWHAAHGRHLPLICTQQQRPRQPHGLHVCCPLQAACCCCMA